MNIPGQFMPQSLIMCILHGLHRQFPPPQQLHCGLYLLLMNLTIPFNVTVLSYNLFLK